MAGQATSLGKRIDGLKGTPLSAQSGLGCPVLLGTGHLSAVGLWPAASAATLTVHPQAAGTHLASVEPVVQPGPVLDSREQQSVHDVLPDGGQHGQTEAHAQKHEESRKVFDAHLQSLWQNRKRKAMNARLHLAPHLFLDAHPFLAPGRAGDYPSLGAWYASLDHVGRGAQPGPRAQHASWGAGHIQSYCLKGLRVWATL